MKLGTSLSRCVRDIYEGNVDENDVLVIIARTDIDPNNDQHWNEIWNGYKYGGLSNPEWQNIPDEDADKIRAIILQLYDDGKLHQPRQFGAYPRRMRDYWYDVILTPVELENNPVAQDAWDTYKIAAKLSR